MHLAAVARCGIRCGHCLQRRYGHQPAVRTCIGKHKWNAPEKQAFQRLFGCAFRQAGLASTESLARERVPEQSPDSLRLARLRFRLLRDQASSAASSSGKARRVAQASLGSTKEKARSTDSPERASLYLVGLEPTRPEGHRLRKPERLPFRHKSTHAVCSTVDGT